MIQSESMFLNVINMNPKEQFEKLYNSLLKRRQSWNYTKLYNKMVLQTPDYQLVIDGGKGEEEWLSRWQPLLSHKLSPLSYRIFSHMAGESIDRLPLEVCVNVVEPTLNPRNYRTYYDDKNSLPLIMDGDWLPITYLRSLNGHLFNKDWNIVVDESSMMDLITSKRVIVKPSCEQSGRGVQIFKCDENGNYYNKNGEKLNLAFLRNQYKDNWLIQDCLNQSEELARFNPTSINTIRIATYRSIDGKIHPIGQVLRVGKQGAEVDNAHAGGMFCGIDAEGHLGHYFCDALARKKTVFNDIDLANNNYSISNMNMIREFVCKAASRIVHHDLVAFDVAITKDGTPKLLEINIGGFSAWLFEMTQQSTFGYYTEEIIQRCKNK